MSQPLVPAIFLDRDGVIVEHRDDYVKSLAEAKIMPNALAAMARLAASPYLIVIATNQSPVGRGIIPLAEAEAINRWMVEEVRRGGGRIDGLYMCPHAPEAGCACRKPQPGLLFDAAAELNIDLARSVMIGDAVTDLQAGQAAGTRWALLRTGRGRVQAALLASNGFAETPIFADLAEAVEALLAGRL